MTWWAAVTSIAEASTLPVLQIAADGSWETACVVGAEDGVHASVALGQVASRAARDVAVEVLWPGQSFVGVRWSLHELEEAAAGLSAAAATLEAAARQVPGPAGALLALLGGEPGPQVDLVELGAVNAWASTGAETLWRPGQPSAPLLEELAARRPDLARCAHPVAVEVAASVPRPCWVGVVVSQPAGLFHHVDVAAVAGVIAAGIPRLS